MYKSAQTYNICKQHEMAHAIGQDLLKRLVRLKPSDLGKHSILLLLASISGVKQIEYCKLAAGLGQKRAALCAIRDNDLKNLYGLIGSQCVEVLGSTVIVN